MRKLISLGLRLLALLLVLLCVYTALMCAAYAFPDTWIERNVRSAMGMVQEEANGQYYANYFWHTGFSVADTPTDTTIFAGLLRRNRDVWQAAMRTDYARYWHGYAVVLRPLCIVLSIVNIRYLNMMLLMCLLLLCTCKCRERFGWPMALCFALGLLMSFFLLAPFCQQYMPVTALALLGCCALLYGWRAMRARLYEGFFLLGSLVCFFDFLTFPVLALGYPLVLALLLLLDEGNGAKRLWLWTFALSAVWLAGYGLTWLGKGVIGSLGTGKNVVADILSQAAFRTTGEFIKEGQTHEISARTAIATNLETFFMGANAALFILLVALCALAALRHRAPSHRWLCTLPIMAVSLWPLAWYCTLQNHSRMHFWMTYKSLSVTVFAPCAALLSVRSACQKSPERL